MNLTEFKSELKLVTTDEWGDAMDAWFECAGRLYANGWDVPNKWNYRPAPVRDRNDVCELESYWHDLFRNATREQLIEIGNYLENLCQFLEMAGKSY